MTSLALYGLLRSLILACNAIPRIADFHDRSSRAFRYVFGYTYMYVCKITCACNLHTHVYTHTFIYIHTIVLTEAHELVCMKITTRKRAHVLSHDPSSHQKNVKQNYSFPAWRLMCLSSDVRPRCGSASNLLATCKICSLLSVLLPCRQIRLLVSVYFCLRCALIN